MLQVEPSTHTDLMTSRQANTQLIPSKQEHAHSLGCFCLFFVLFCGFFSFVLLVPISPVTFKWVKVSSGYHHEVF